MKLYNGILNSDNVLNSLDSSYEAIKNTIDDKNNQIKGLIFVKKYF